MAISIIELENVFKEADLRYRVREDKEGIITGMATRHYVDPEGHKGVMIQLRFSEKQNIQTAISSNAILLFKLRIEEASKQTDDQELTRSEINKMLDKSLEETGESVGEALYELINFVIAPLRFSSDKKPPRGALISIANKVNNKIKFSSFSIDDEDDVIYIYQFSLDDKRQKLYSGGLQRVIGAMAQACDEFYNAVEEYNTGGLKDIDKSGDVGSQRASKDRADSDSNSDSSENGDEALTKRAAKLFIENFDQQLNEQDLERLIHIIGMMVERGLIKDAMSDVEIVNIVKITIAKLESEAQDESDDQES